MGREGEISQRLVTGCADGRIRLCVVRKRDVMEEDASSTVGALV